MWMFLFIQTIFVSTLTGMSVSVGHKDKLWLYRKAPNGIDIYLRARILQFLVLFLPMTSISIFVGYYFFNNAGLLLTLVGLVFSFLYVLAAITLGIGVFALNPVHERRGPKVALNMMVIMTIMMPVMVIGMVFPLIFIFGDSTSMYNLNSLVGILNFATLLGFPSVPLLVVSAILLFIGARSLQNRED